MKFFIEKDIKNNYLQKITALRTIEEYSCRAISNPNDSAESLIFCKCEILRKESGERINT